MQNIDFLTQKFGKYAWVLALVFILLPIILVSFVPNIYNPLVQVLFDFALFGASLWFGVFITNKDAKEKAIEAEKKAKEAEKKATDKWLVAAGNACMELAEMRESARQMRLKQGSVCHLIEKIIPGIPPEKLEPVKELMGLNCNGCSSNIADLQNRIENIRQSYSLFVNANCTESECTDFHELFDRRDREIRATFENISSVKP